MITTKNSKKTRLRMRDWMPITIDGKGDLAQFRYAPDYLRAPRYKKWISPTSMVT